MAEHAPDGLATFGPAHWLALLSIGLTVGVVLAVARCYRTSGATERWLTVGGWILMVIVIWWAARDLLPHRFSLEHSIPVDLSDLARFLTAYALITRAGWAVVTIYYWGLSLNVAALLTPDLRYGENPALEFTMFWVGHGIVLAVPVVLVWGLGYRPTWWGFGAAYLLTAAWAAVGLSVNAVTGANYGYLTEPPAAASPIDAMGPWPIYLLVIALILATVWSVLTWPWNTTRALVGTEPVGRLMRRQ